MSRIGRQAIPLPKGVSANINNGLVAVKGAKGELKVVYHTDMTVKEDAGSIVVERPSDGRTHRSLHGLTRSLIANAVTGVSTGYQRNLELHGVGFRAKLTGKNLEMAIGYSHPVDDRAASRHQL